MKDLHSNEVNISICIPAFKNINFLKRLLDSIAIQTYLNYEVIVTDDSPDDAVEQFINSYSSISNIKYFRNNPARGTPGNWNEGISKACGKWIKIMHDDDWFASPDALFLFNEAALRHPEVSFFFSAFQNVHAETGKIDVVRCNMLDLFFLKLNSLHLFKRVYVGNPSCIFIRREIDLFYDEQFKFVVDFEYYIQCLKKVKKFEYIDDILISVGFNKEQVTKYTFLNPAVQIPENYRLLEKLGHGILRNIFVYDYYWRMHRNLKVINEQKVKEFYNGNTPPVIKQMVSFQGKIPFKILQVGLFSKMCMGFSYIRSHFIKET